MSTPVRVAGVVLITEINRQVKLIMRVRESWNWKKHQPESWPGCVQVTAFGKCQSNEDMRHCAVRELIEEVGLSHERATHIGQRMVSLALLASHEQHLQLFAARVPLTVIDPHLESVNNCLLPMTPAKIRALVSIEQLHAGIKEWRTKNRYMPMTIGQHIFQDTQVLLADIDTRISEFPLIDLSAPSSP